jgi:predicted nucleotidyltransferase
MHPATEFSPWPVVYNDVGMIDLIEQHRPQIAELCRRYRVKKLELFGSAASGEFDPARSDVDFFYEFDETDISDIADRFFDLKEQLEAMLGHKVDMVSARDAKNPYFLAEANRHRQTLYAA